MNLKIAVLNINYLRKSWDRYLIISKKEYYHKHFKNGYKINKECKMKLMKEY